jgi:FkbM family methyltransferase
MEDGEVMEDLWFNQNSAFTRWIVSKGLLQEPFVLVDVGVQGDAHNRWDVLGDHLVVHGFDPIEEVISGLQKRNGQRPNRHYYHVAIGDNDGEATFYFNAANPTASSMYSQGGARFHRELSERPRTVPMRRLDSLLGDGTISAADFLKVDVEGFERSVLAGSRTLLSAGVLGVETETNFGVSPTYPKGHFFALSEILVEHYLLTFDLSYNRVPRLSFIEALAQRADERAVGAEHGKPATVNVLFCRDLIDESDAPHHYLSSPHAVNLDQILKMMAIYELYGLNDIALDTAVRFRELLSKRLDVERAIVLLADAWCRAERPAAEPARGEDWMARASGNERLLRATRARLDAIEKSTSWRITAPLRAAKTIITGLQRGR